MAFYVGQKVVCVNPQGTNIYGQPELLADRIYIVRWAGDFVHSSQGLYSGISVEGIRRQGTVTPGDIPFNAKRFRPVVEKRTDISIFTAMLTPSDEQVQA